LTSDDIEPFDWYSRFFDEIFRRRREREFEDMEGRIPKDLIREYNAPEGGKVRKVGPIVYGYSMTIGPDGKPKVREFGNVKSTRGLSGFTRPEISSETEPLMDVITTDKEIKVVVEMPGITKDKITINIQGNILKVKGEDPPRRYHRTIEIPIDTNIETAKSTYNNGILEITFKKKEQATGKTIKVE
jgi:HSP20 family protein